MERIICLPNDDNISNVLENLKDLGVVIKSRNECKELKVVEVVIDCGENEILENFVDYSIKEKMIKEGENDLVLE